jgi:hypothetical protein
MAEMAVLEAFFEHPYTTMRGGQQACVLAA